MCVCVCVVCVYVHVYTQALDAKVREFEVMVHQQSTLCAQCGRNASDGAAGSAGSAGVGSGSAGKDLAGKDLAGKDLAIARQQLEVSKTMLANKDARSLLTL